MLNLNNLLVCLDGTNLDDHLLKYSAMMARFFTNTKTTFIHVAETNGDQSIKHNLQEKVNTFFDSDCEKEVLVIQGTGAHHILSWEGLKEIDLVLMGIKPRSVSTGVQATRVLNGSLCSVMLVPVTAKYDVSKVLIPLDFSEDSLRSINTAIRIKEHTDIEIFLQHVYFVPNGYSSTGKTYEDFAEIMRKNKVKEYETFIKQNELDESKFEVVFTLDEDQKPSDNIYEMAKEKNVDLIIIASKGRTKAASMLLASTAVGLVHYDEDVPCLVVKDKNESIGFFDALLKI
ncbi:universal stress protein [Reichenbachiella agarivorans]|uniref:Universal stress protein n=1 Tax=Reichenbachiella agarivorans TaxID=2979464 RepID=A0ABY6CUU8_9BACT|nr:universal stress protein [Reichenbachiella agarivorans]UXP33218.1 universal stress protein [Reichenbachiella agarivorans]